MRIVITEEQYHYIKRRYVGIKPILEREMEDQVPSWFNDRYGINGFKRYYDTVRYAVVEFILFSVPGFYNMGDENEVILSKKLSNEFDSLFGDTVKRYYQEHKDDEL